MCPAAAGGGALGKNHAQPLRRCPKQRWAGQEPGSSASNEGMVMVRRDSDTLVLFGATGDLCYRKIFPSLYNLVRRGLLHVPVIGVARAGWSLEQLAGRVRDSIKNFVTSPDEEALSRLVSLLRYHDGDYRDRETFVALRKALGDSQRPLYYLAIPPSMFPVVIDHLGSSGSAQGARVVIEKPFGRDLASARALNQVLH